MKSVIYAAIAASVLAAPITSFAQSEQGLTRDQVRPSLCNSNRTATSRWRAIRSIRTTSGRRTTHSTEPADARASRYEWLRCRGDQCGPSRPSHDARSTESRELGLFRQLNVPGSARAHRLIDETRTRCARHSPAGAEPPSPHSGGFPPRRSRVWAFCWAGQADVTAGVPWI